MKEKTLFFILGFILLFFGVFLTYKTDCFASGSSVSQVYYSLTPGSLIFGSNWGNESVQYRVANSNGGGIFAVKTGTYQYKLYTFDYAVNGVAGSTTGLVEFIYCGRVPNSEVNNYLYPPSYSPAQWVQYSTSLYEYTINFSSSLTLNLQAPVFQTVQDAKNYIQNGDESGLVGGSQYLPESPINWGTGSGVNGEDSENIPAPQFKAVYDSDGNLKHSIEFTNQIYNSREHGVYGLAMTVCFRSVDDVTLKHKGTMFDSTTQIFYNSVVDGEITTIYGLPDYESEQLRCPAFFNFDTDSECQDLFSTFLSSFPVANRSIDNTSITTTGLNFYNFFKNNLANSAFQYNAIYFSCFYYRQMSDGTWHYGPSTQGQFTLPVSGATWDVNSGGLSDLTPANPNSGGGLDANSPDWNYDVGGGGNLDINNLDVSELRQSLNGLFSFFGDVPMFVNQLFGFLPVWVITFIAVSIGLMIAIGVIKTLIG